ncbi:MAG: DoxX family protein [Longimonas sp.]|uniref:DoxX family protein n=1 Tax=Longimonas sp. TaxID=2039626 RepID=UPI0039750C14
MQTLSLYAIAAMFIAAGVAHFIKPSIFTRIVPTYLPAPRLLVYASGVFEIAGGAGVLIPSVQVYAAWGLIGMLVVFLPVHTFMARDPEGRFSDLPNWMLWLRIPLQFVLMAWVYWAAVLTGS